MPQNPPQKSTLNIPNVHLVQSCLIVFLNVHVDGKMGVDISHLVLETLANSNDQIVDDSFDCTERRHVLAGAVVEFDVDDRFRGFREADGKMR